MSAKRRRRWAVLAMAAACSAVLALSAGAAELSVRAPDACADASDIREQVDGLLGRPLAAVEGVDFDVEIAPGPGVASWRLRVDAVDRAEPGRGGKHTRELSGKTCAELADAAAVAIAMSIRAGESTASSHAAASTPAPAPAPEPTAFAVAPPPPAAPKAWHPRGAIGLAIVAEAGALPSVGPGAALEGSLDLPVLRLMAVAALFAPRDARTGAAAGTFQLAFGALLACAPKALARLTVLACLGGEVGRLAGEGDGVQTPQLGSSLWIAARAEAGVSIPIASRLSIGVRGGVAVPLQRPLFVVDHVTRVYQPGMLAARGTVGLQIEF